MYQMWWQRAYIHTLIKVSLYWNIYKYIFPPIFPSHASARRRLAWAVFRNISFPSAYETGYWISHVMIHQAHSPRGNSIRGTQTKTSTHIFNLISNDTLCKQWISLLDGKLFLPGRESSCCGDASLFWLNPDFIIAAQKKPFYKHTQ